MRRFKLIMNCILLGAILALGAGYVIKALEAWEARPYKKTFVEYQRTTFREAWLIHSQKALAEGRAKLIPGKKPLSQLQDTLTLAEENLYKALCDFPQKYKKYTSSAKLVHEQILNLRKYRARGFKESDESPFPQYVAALDSIRKNHHDCHIIKKVEERNLRK